jgi:hypothetical protein
VEIFRNFSIFPIGNFLQRNTNWLLVVIATVEVAPYFRLFLFIVAMLNTFYAQVKEDEIS